MKYDFISISLENYIKSHIKINPKENPKKLRQLLKEALAARQQGIKCFCGNDIWVIGSAFVGNSCFT